MINMHRNRLVALVLVCLSLAACATQEKTLEPKVNYYSDGAIKSDQDELEQAPRLRVMTLNIAHARGTGVNQMFQGTHRVQANLNGIAQLLNQEDPDIVSLQEADRQSFWNGRFDHVSFLAEKGGFRQSVSGTHVKGMGLDYGTALVAKLDLGNPESITFSPSEVSGPKGFVVSSIVWPGSECLEVDVISAHLDFASGETRREQAAEIIATLKQRDRPIILMGDMNSGWRRTNSAVRKLAEELDLHPYEPDARSMVTFPKHNRRLDWILVSPEIRFQSYRVVEARVSDHLGVVSELEINRGCG